MKRARCIEQQGFTIVELLIVIVVIAILASISIVAYTGIQTRAKDSVVVSKVSSLVKLFETYAAANDGKVPQADWACIGEPDDFPAQNGYAAEWCTKPDATPPIPTGNVHPISSTTNASLKSIVNKVPSGRLPEVVDGAYTWRGIVYDSSATQNGGKPVLGFRVSGNRTSCPIGDMMYSTATATRCEYYFTDVVSETGT